jgi:cell division ATPase FtsA
MNHNNKYTDKLVVALDIGTTKVCALAGTLNEH